MRYYYSKLSNMFSSYGKMLSENWKVTARELELAWYGSPRDYIWITGGQLRPCASRCVISHVEQKAFLSSKAYIGITNHKS